MNTGLYVPELCESLDASGGAVEKERRPRQRANDRLPRRSLASQTRTEELGACAPAVIHKLKSPLSVIIMTSNAIFNITDLTPEELYEYLQQIRSTAYKMNEIIENLALRSEMQEADAP